MAKAVIFFVVFFIPCFSSAQKINYGIKGGVNLSGILNTAHETRSKTGYNVYSFADYNASRNFSLRAQVGYTQKGFRTEPYDYYIDKIHYSGSINANLNYIDISVSGKLIFNIGIVNPYISVGPSLGIKVSTGTSVTGNSGDNSRTQIQVLLDYIYKNSFGIKAGAGVEIHLINKMSIILETNYNCDLISSYDAPNFRLGIETWYYSSNVRNNVLEFSVGVKF